MSKAREEYLKCLNSKSFETDDLLILSSKAINYIIDLEQLNTVLEDDKRIFIAECNELRIKKIKLEQEKAELIEFVIEDIYNK
jgi:hypothetical protein